MINFRTNLFIYSKLGTLRNNCRDTKGAFAGTNDVIRHQNYGGNAVEHNIIAPAASLDLDERSSEIIRLVSDRFGALVSALMSIIFIDLHFSSFLVVH